MTEKDADKLSGERKYYKSDDFLVSVCYYAKSKVISEYSFESEKKLEYMQDEELAETFGNIKIGYAKGVVTGYYNPDPKHPLCWQIRKNGEMLFENAGSSTKFDWFSHVTLRNGGDYEIWLAAYEIGYEKNYKAVSNVIKIDVGNGRNYKEKPLEIKLDENNHAICDDDLYTQLNIYWVYEFGGKQVVYKNLVGQYDDFSYWIGDFFAPSDNRRQGGHYDVYIGALKNGEVVKISNVVSFDYVAD